MASRYVRANREVDDALRYLGRAMGALRRAGVEIGRDATTSDAAQRIRNAGRDLETFRRSISRLAPGYTDVRIERGTGRIVAVEWTEGEIRWRATRDAAGSWFYDRAWSLRVAVHGIGGTTPRDEVLAWLEEQAAAGAVLSRV